MARIGNANNEPIVTFFGNRDARGPFGPTSNFPADSLALSHANPGAASAVIDTNRPSVISDPSPTATQWINRLGSTNPNHAGVKTSLPGHPPHRYL
jgi:hypothetical protein